jgi:hypothetical protein
MDCRVKPGNDGFTVSTIFRPIFPLGGSQKIGIVLA